MQSNPYKIACEIELDHDAGYHAILIDAEDDEVIHVTNSFNRPEDAEQAALDWLDRRRTQTLERKPA